MIFHSYVSLPEGVRIMSILFSKSINYETTGVLKFADSNWDSHSKREVYPKRLIPDSYPTGFGTVWIHLGFTRLGNIGVYGLRVFPHARIFFQKKEYTVPEKNQT